MRTQPTHRDHKGEKLENKIFLLYFPSALSSPASAFKWPNLMRSQRAKRSVFLGTEQGRKRRVETVKANGKFQHTQ